MLHLRALPSQMTFWPFESILSTDSTLRSLDRSTRLESTMSIDSTSALIDGLDRFQGLLPRGPSLDTTYNSLAAVEPSTLLLCDSDNNETYCNCTLRRTYKIGSFLSCSSVNKSLQHWQQNLALLLPPVEQLWQFQVIVYALRSLGRCRPPE